MKLCPTYVHLASGNKIVNGYKIGLTKSQVEKSGFVAGEDVDIIYSKNKIVIKKRKPNV